MSKYLDRHGVALHKDDAVRLEGCGQALEHAEGVIHSFYLMRDGKDRARVHLAGQGGRAVGVKVELLTKIHDDGPEPVFDGLMAHAGAISHLLRQKVVPPGESKARCAAGPHGEAVNALTAALLAAIGALDAAVRNWPPPIDTTGKLVGGLTPLAVKVKRTSDHLRACPPSADAMLGVAEPAKLVGPLRALTELLLEGASKVLDAFGCYLPVEKNFLDVDEATGELAGGVARITAGGRIAEAFKSASQMARIPQVAFGYRDEAVAVLYGARRCVPSLRPLFYEAGAALERAHAHLESAVAPSLAARLGLHKPPRASVHAREERRGGYLFYVPEDWAGASEPLPLVVALHGRESNGPSFFWRLARLAASRRFALLAPSALGISWGAPPPEWALPDPKRPGANADVDNVLSLIDELHSRYPIDSRRTLLLGFCEGAPFALKLAFAARQLAAADAARRADGERFAAIALLGSGVPSVPTRLPTRAPELDADASPSSAAASPAALRVYWAAGTLDALHPAQRVRRSALELAANLGAQVEIEWRSIDGLPHVFPPEDEVRRVLMWLDTHFVRDGEERPHFTPLRPPAPTEVAPPAEEGTAAGAETAPPPQQQTGGNEAGADGDEEARTDGAAVSGDVLDALLRRLELGHLGKRLAAEEIDLALLRSMRDFPVELAELGASAEELTRLEAAIHEPALPASEVDSGDEGAPLLEVN